MLFIRLVLTVLLATFCLTGCIESDIGINYISQTQGEIVQQIRLGERLDLDSETARGWLQAVEQRSRQLGGHTQRSTERELIVTLPFNNGKDLETKFNAFFQSPEAAIAPSSSVVADLPPIKSQLRVTERNLVVVQRNRLSLEVDLRSLGVRSSTGKLLMRPGSLLDLEFRLTTPWGARNPNLPESDPNPPDPTLTWTLQPGELNHLDAVFWIPSPLGIGSVAIALLVILGATLRAALFGVPQ